MARLVECLEPEPGSDMPMAIPEQRPATIMVVEDNAANRQLASSMLARLGHTVVTAEDGQEALDKLAELRVRELVFMDMQMPVLDGLEATRRLRTREAAAGQAPLTVVALTATSARSGPPELHRGGHERLPGRRSAWRKWRASSRAGCTDVSRQPAPSEAPERGGQLAVTAAPAST